MLVVLAASLLCWAWRFRPHEPLELVSELSPDSRDYYLVRGGWLVRVRQPGAGAASYYAQSVFVRRIGGGAERVLVPPSRNGAAGHVVAITGTDLYFVGPAASTQTPALWRVPLARGVPTQVAVGFEFASLGVGESHPAGRADFCWSSYAVEAAPGGPFKAGIWALAPGASAPRRLATVAVNGHGAPDPLVAARGGRAYWLAMQRTGRGGGARPAYVYRATLRSVPTTGGRARADREVTGTSRLSPPKPKWVAPYEDGLGWGVGAIGGSEAWMLADAGGKLTRALLPGCEGYVQEWRGRYYWPALAGGARELRAALVDGSRTWTLDRVLERYPPMGRRVFAVSPAVWVYRSRLFFLRRAVGVAPALFEVIRGANGADRLRQICALPSASVVELHFDGPFCYVEVHPPGWPGSAPAGGARPGGPQLYRVRL